MYDFYKDMVFVLVFLGFILAIVFLHFSKSPSPTRDRGNARSLIKISTIGFLIVSFLILAYGNPQWGKYIYLFQAHIFPGTGDELGIIKPPENYRGTVWKHYTRDGRMIELDPHSFSH